jgi:polyphosphate kinase
MLTRKNERGEQYFDRDLNWLAFNERVIEEAEDTANPLLERAKFIAIFASNLDEFYMKRVASLRRLMDESPNHADGFGFHPVEVYDAVEQYVTELRKRLYRAYDEVVGRELPGHGIRLKPYEELDERERTRAQEYFETTLYPVMTPMAVDQGRPFPILPSKTLSFAVKAQGEKKHHLAILPIPQVVPRLFRLPGASPSFILIDEIVRAHLEAFFRGHPIVESAMFRVVRDSELDLDEEAVDDLLYAVEKEVRKRPRARAVAMEIERHVSPQMLDHLCKLIDIETESTKLIAGHLDLSFLFALPGQVARPGLAYPGFVPAGMKYKDIFERMRRGEFLVHLPFQSFQPVIDLIQSAAEDEQVLAIKMTLYRTNETSAVVKALMRAAENGKQITVLVELRARFDEERNISWARALEQAGCHVIYGIPGLKIHSKLAVIIRREEDGIRRYVHLGTGNYNESTARLYTDIGFFTVNEDIARDVSDTFNVISGYSQPPHWRKVVSAPHDLKPFLFHLIDQEIEHQKLHGNGLVFAKCNALQDKEMIDKLYEAARAGVRMKLLVRGLCCMVPGVKGLSETVEVRSIVGRFLEHSRIYLFHNNGNPRVFCSSADWMKRNLDRRIELMFPIEDRDLKQHLSWLLDTYWQDNVKARVLMPDGSYVRVPRKGEALNVQEFLIQHYAAQRKS